MHASINGVPFGQPHAGRMHFRFVDLIRHVTKTSGLRAGTILLSGTVSEGDPDRVGSACIAEMRGKETIEQGSPVTPFLHFGDSVRIDMFDDAGRTIFGALDQHVVNATV